MSQIPGEKAGLVKHSEGQKFLLWFSTVADRTSAKVGRKSDRLESICGFNVGVSCRVM